VKLVDYQNPLGQHIQIFEAEIGDTVWFAQGGDEYLDGVVIQILTIIGEDIPHYLIEVETAMGSWYAVRDGGTISDYKDRPLAWMRGCGLG
jgi:hypothetical protein